MKSKLVVLLMTLLLLAGCSMDRKEVIAAVKECEAAGMRPVLKFQGYRQGIYDVQCLPLEVVHE